MIEISHMEPCGEHCYSLDAIEVEYCAHVLRQRHGVWPHEVICDRNYVLLTSQGRDYLLQDNNLCQTVSYKNMMSCKCTNVL